MIRRLLLGLVLAVPAACSGDGTPPLPGAGGRFEIRHPDESRLIRAAALASYCASDSSLTILAFTDDASGGMAARLNWPPPPTDTLRLNRRLTGLGMATLAWRPRGDSITAALIADSGTAELRGTTDVSGWAVGFAPTSDTTVVRLEARISNVPVEQHCPGDPR